MLTPFTDDQQVDESAYRQLINFYLSHGCSGLFAVCLSSEIQHLSLDEMVRLAEVAVETINDRVPVVAGAVADVGLDELTRLTNDMARTGVDAIVLAAGTIVPAEAPEAAWRNTFAKLLVETQDADLGIYECPWPNHRRLSPDTMAWLAETDRVIFHKDTSCDASLIRAKCEAVSGSRLAFYNAHLPTLQSSIEAGGSGYSGVACNFAPELLAARCNGDSRPQTLSLLDRLDQLIPASYPANAKAFLGMRGLSLGTTCRLDVELEPDNLKQLEDFHHDLQHWTPASDASRLAENASIQAA